MRYTRDALRRPTLTATAALSTLLALPGAAAAQQAHDHGHTEPPVMAQRDHDDGALARALLAGPHRELSPARQPAPGDSARAAAVADELRRSIAKYEDVATAEADGYRRFAPQVPRQAVYHYVNPRRAWREKRQFAPSEPGVLLYREGSGGRLELVGAMYTAPADATPDDLNARVPLSVARWHRHVNFCVFRRDASDPAPPGTRGWRRRFTVRSEIATAEACERAGGRFVAQRGGWMVHANVFAGDMPAEIWGHGTAHGAMH
jgi:hypothetical protein